MENNQHNNKKKEHNLKHGDGEASHEQSHNEHTHIHKEHTHGAGEDMEHEHTHEHEENHKHEEGTHETHAHQHHAHSQTKKTAKSDSVENTSAEQTVPIVREYGFDQNKVVWTTIISTILVLAAVVMLGFAVFWLIQSPNGFSLTPTTGGQIKGTITIVEYSDFECPFCSRAQDSLKQLKAKYGDRLQIEFKHLPLSFHPNAQKAAEASECARDQNKFWEYHDVLFANQDKLSVSNLKQHAVDLKLDTEKFNTCLDGSSKAAVVKQHSDEATALGLSGTPSFIIGGKEKVVGAVPVAQFEAAIQKAYGVESAKKVETKDGKLLIVEYSDFECPFCGRVQPTLKQIKQIYGDKIVFEFKHFPLSFHSYAQKAAEASECARDQNKFWEYHDVLFENQDKLSVSDLKQYAVNLGLDTEKFNTCLDGSSKASVVKADMAQGQTAGIEGTPGYLIGGEVLSGAQPLSAFQAVIDKQLAAMSGKTDSATTQPTTPTPTAQVGANDPVIKMTIIDDPSCISCDAELVGSMTKEQIFPTVEITKLNKTDQTAKTLIEKYKIKAFPAFIFDAQVSKAESFARVSPAFDVFSDAYILKPGAAGPITFDEMPKINKTPKGDINAPIEIIEFSEFECPFCKMFIDETYGNLVKNYIDTGKANIVFMHLPLSFHANAKQAANAAECAREQAKFWEYHDELFKDQKKLSVTDLKTHAKTIGLDQATFDACLDSNKHYASIEAESAIAQEYGIGGTPGFIINGEVISGALPYAEFQRILDGKLALIEQ